MLGILAIHLLALAAFGGWTVYQAVMPKDPTFDEPPPMERIERVQLEYKVRLQEQQKKSQRPTQKLQVQQIANIEMPNFDAQVPTLTGSGGLGRFGEGGFGSLGDGEGLSLGEISVDLFDIKAKGEKFLFVIDVRKDLLQDKKGGIPTYNVIKEDITRLVNELPSGVLINMILFEGSRMEIWRPELAPATASNKQAFAEWLAPVNTGPDSTGIRDRNYTPDAFQQPMAERLLSRGGSGNRVLLATVGALEQKPDAIFFLVDDIPALDSLRERLIVDEKEMEKRRKEYLDRIKAATSFNSIEEYEEARKKTAAQVRREVEAFKKRENEARKAKGLPPRVYTWGENHQLRQRMEEVVEKKSDDYVPWVRGLDRDDQPLIPEREVLAWLEQQMRLNFDQHADERPQLNAIIFRGKDEGFSEAQEEAVDDFVDLFGGDYRILEGLGQIDSEAARN